MSSKNDDFFGGLFDFNGDGKTTWDEKFLAYNIFEETTKEEIKAFLCRFIYFKSKVLFSLLFPEDLLFPDDLLFPEDLLLLL